jgi:hypothetical protein
LLNREKRHWKSPIIELGSPNYAKVGAKSMHLEGKEVDMISATTKGLDYRYFGAMKFVPIRKDLFDNSPRGEEEEVYVCDL